MYTELSLKLTQYQVKLSLILSQHLKRAKVNSERQFSHLVSRTYSITLTQYQLKVQLSSIYPKHLYSEPTVLQGRRWLYLSKMQCKFFIVSKAIYGLYLKPCMVWVLVFRTYDQTLTKPSLHQFSFYTLLNNSTCNMEWLLFGRPIMFFLSPPPSMLILLARAFKLIDLLHILH